MSGSDVKNFRRSLTEDREAHLAGMERRVVNGRLSIHRLRRMAKPVVVAIQGAASGFGLSVVCAADLAIAADDAVFNFAYRQVGLTADGGLSYFLPRILGERRALQLTLLGERISARQALEWGLLNSIVPKEHLQDEAWKLAAKLASGPSLALGGIKRLVRQSHESSWEQQLAREAESIAQMVATDDHLEGVSAFLEKREPRFSGR